MVRNGNRCKLIGLEHRSGGTDIVLRLRSFPIDPKPRSDARKRQEIVMLSKLVQMILMGCVVLAATSASAQTYDPRYPVCMKVTEWGGGPYID